MGWRTKLKAQAGKEVFFYILAALSAAIADLLFFTILLFMGAHYMLAQGFARCVGGGSSFLINKYYGFSKAGNKTSVQIRRFLLLYAASYVISLTLLHIFHNVLGIRVYYAKLGADGTSFIINFMAMKLYVYAGVKGLTHHAHEWFGKFLHPKSAPTY